MAMPTFTMRNLLEAGVHYGHHPRRWNPKMAPYLFGVRNGVHIINLEQTVPMLYQAMQVARDTVAQGGRVLFVGTKRQASDIVADAARRCGQYYVNHRWLGGMMTNWKTVSKSIKSLREYEELFEKESEGFTKKELLHHTRAQDKLVRNIGGIKEMGGVPNLLFVIDTNKEDTAVKEAVTLGIPVIGIIDSNCSPDHITYPVPGNDDAIRAIQLYCDLIAGAILDGLQNQLIAAGVDVGEAQDITFDENGDKEVAPTPQAAHPAKKMDAPKEGGQSLHHEENSEAAASETDHKSHNNIADQPKAKREAGDANQAPAKPKALKTKAAEKPGVAKKQAKQEDKAEPEKEKE